MTQHQQDDVLRRKVLSNVRFVSIALFTTMFLSLVMRMYMPRVLGVERLGSYYFAESYSAFFITFMSLGIETYIVRTIPKDPGAASEVFFTSTVFEVFTTVVLLGTMAVSLHAVGYPVETVKLAVILGLYAATVSYQATVVRGSLLALDQYRLVATAEIATKVIQVISVVAALAWKPDLDLIAACFFGAELAELAMLAPYAWRAGLLVPRFRTDALVRVLKVGLPFFIAGMFSQLNSNIDTVLLQRLSNTTEVGYYGSAMRLKGVLLMLIPIIANALMPELSRTLQQDEAAYARLARDSIRTILAIGFGPTLALIVLADRVTVLLYGAEFAPAARVVAVIGPLVMLTYLSYLLAGQIALTTNGRRMTIATVTMLLLNIALNLTFVPMLGHIWPVAGPATGAAVATLLAETVAASLYAWLLPHKFMDWRMMLMLACIVVPLVLAMMLYGWLVEIPVSWRMAGLFVLLPPYCVGTGILKIRDIKEFLAKLRADTSEKLP